MNLRRMLSVTSFVCVVGAIMNTNATGLQTVYIGTYTGPKSQGIYFSQFDEKNGVLSKPELAIATKNPSFLAAHPNHKFLYAVNEVSDFTGKRKGAASAFAI